MKKTNATATNATATEFMNVNDIFKVFSTEMVNVPKKINFSDVKSQPYCGFDNFSVNVKKSYYNVYMNNDNANLIIENMKHLTVFDNTSDTTKKQLRCKLIRFDVVTDLVNAIKLVCGTYKTANA